MLAATKCRKGSIDMADSDKWRRLCTTLCPENGSLGQDVVLCLEAPDIYFERFEDDLAQRMVESPDELTPWLALVDGLASRNLLWECDWKVVAPELSGCIESLRPCKELELDFEVFNQSDASGDDLMRQAAVLLAHAGLALVQLDIQSDSYPLMAVRLSELPAVQAACIAVGHGEDLIVFLPDAGPLATPTVETSWWRRTLGLLGFSR